MTILFNDNFQRSNAADLGPNYVAQTGGFSILSNECNAISIGAINFAYVAGPLASGAIGGAAGSVPSDQWCEVQHGSEVDTASDNGMGPLCRVDTSPAVITGLFGQSNSTETRLYKVVNTGFTQLGSDGAAAGLDDRIRLTCVGTTLELLKNAATTCGPVTDATLTAGAVGIWDSRSGSGPNAIKQLLAGDFNLGLYFGLTDDVAALLRTQPLSNFAMRDARAWAIDGDALDVHKWFVDEFDEPSVAAAGFFARYYFDMIGQSNHV